MSGWNPQRRGFRQPISGYALACRLPVKARHSDRGGSQMSLKLYLCQLVRSLPPFALAAALLVGPATAQETLKLGLVAAMSGQSAKSGEAIVRGLSTAIDEINAKGGVLGKKVELLVRDDESNPAKG